MPKQPRSIGQRFAHNSILQRFAAGRISKKTNRISAIVRDFRANNNSGIGPTKTGSDWLRARGVLRARFRSHDETVGVGSDVNRLDSVIE
jgi:hypothetical protein